MAWGLVSPLRHVSVVPLAIVIDAGENPSAVIVMVVAAEGVACWLPGSVTEGAGGGVLASGSVVELVLRSRVLLVEDGPN